MAISKRCPWFDSKLVYNRTSTAYIEASECFIFVTFSDQTKEGTY